MEKNKGYTLIELVVVIAIIAVLAGVGILQINMIYGFYSKECAKNLESQLNKVQITNMSKMFTEMEIYKKDDGYYTKVIENKDTPSKRETEQKIGKKSVEITFSTDAKDSTEQTLDAGTVIVIQFKRSTGELETKDSGDPSRINGCHRLWIRQKGSSKYYTVTIHKDTGKIKVETDKVKTKLHSPT